MHKWIIIASFLVFGGALHAHPIKMTTGKVHFISNDTVAQLVFNFFMDDFESELRKMYPQPPFNYAEPSDEMTATIQDYIRKNIDIMVDNVTTKLEVKNIAKIENNVCQVSIDVNYSDALALREIKVRNTLLFLSFSKQSNILHVVVNGESPRILQFYPNHPVNFVRR